MIRRIAAVAFSIALVCPLSTAYAVGTQSYDFCGGSYSFHSGFAFCASVRVTVVQKAASVWNVALTISNMSGQNGSYASSVFSQIGIDNIPGNLSNPANITVSQGDAAVCENKWNDPAPDVKCWAMRQDANASGGFNVDFLGMSSDGFTRNISASCDGDAALLLTCLAAQPVMISFDMSANFNPVTQGQVYVRAEASGGITECETGSSVILSERCVAVQTFEETPVTATPEPATVILMATGLLLVGAFKSVAWRT